MQSLRAYLPRLSLPISRGALQVAAALLGAAFAYQGYVRFDQSRANFDVSAGWLGLAFVCLAVVVWDGAWPHPTTWPARLAAFLRRSWWEMALVLSMVGFVVFLWQNFLFGEFPPSNLICCEEGLRGANGFAVLREGARPLAYPMSVYSIAFGYLLFGESTLGLRVPLLLASVLTVPVFYLLLRELVRVPAALFGTALLASMWVLVATEPGAQQEHLATVLFAYLLVLGIRRRNTLAFLGAGFLAGVLSYEHEALKVVPIVAAGFLMALAAYRLAYPLPEGARAFMARLWSMVRAHWRPAVAFVGAALIALVPLLVTEFQGLGIYFARYDVHAAAAVGDRPLGIFSTQWKEQLAGAAEFFLPFGPQDFTVGEFPEARMVDPITGTLLVMGVIAGLVTFYRPFRLLFLAWYLAVLGGAAILTEPFSFGAFKYLTVLPAGIVLMAFVVDDVGWGLARWSRRAAVYLLPLLLLGSVVYVAYWNANTLFGTAQKDGALLAGYEHPSGQQYALCDYLQGRGRETPSYVFNVASPARGFARPHETLFEQKGAWGDFRWVCQDLRGHALASPAEVWPMRDIPTGPLTLAFLITSPDTEELVASLGRVIPGKMEPDRIIAGSHGLYNSVVYELSGQELKAGQGLFGQYRSGEGGTVLAERVDDVHRVLWDAQSGLSPPFTVEWRGLIYVSQASRAALTALTSDPTLIRLDGQVSYSLEGEEVGLFPRDLLPGWHPVEILLRKETPGGSFALQWVGPESVASPVAGQDLFALASLAGWTHERETIASNSSSSLITQRFDFAPYFASAEVIGLQLQRPEEAPATVIGERWSAAWHVPEGREYHLKLLVRSGSALVNLDGATVITVGSLNDGGGVAEAVIPVSAGDHRLEIEQQHDGGAWTGAMFDITAPDDPAYTPEFSPY